MLTVIGNAVERGNNWARARTRTWSGTQFTPHASHGSWGARHGRHLLLCLVQPLERLAHVNAVIIVRRLHPEHALLGDTAPVVFPVTNLSWRTKKKWTIRWPHKEWSKHIFTPKSVRYKGVLWGFSHTFSRVQEAREELNHVHKSVLIINCFRCNQWLSFTLQRSLDQEAGLQTWGCKPGAATLGLQTWGCNPGAANLGLQTWGCKPPHDKCN